MPRTIADILRGMGEAPPSDMVAVDDGPPEPPVAFWIDPARIRASTARDVRERVNDDRSLAWRREIGARSAAIGRALRPKPRYTFGAPVKSIRPKTERTVEQKAAAREYAKHYMRERRAREKAEEQASP